LLDECLADPERIGPMIRAGMLRATVPFDFWSAQYRAREQGHARRRRQPQAGGRDCGLTLSPAEIARCGYVRPAVKSGRFADRHD
jgi:hypothetical protein